MAKQAPLTNKTAQALLDEFLGGGDKKAVEEKAQDRPKRRSSKKIEDDPYQRLALAAKGRISVPLADMDWVFDNCELPVEKIDADLVPSTGAVGLLKWVQESDSARDRFYSAMWPKRFPSKRELDEEQRMRDDGQVIDLIDRVASAARRAEKAQANDD